MLFVQKLNYQPCGCHLLVIIADPDGDAKKTETQVFCSQH